MSVGVGVVILFWGWILSFSDSCNLSDSGSDIWSGSVNITDSVSVSVSMIVGGSWSGRWSYSCICIFSVSWSCSCSGRYILICCVIVSCRCYWILSGSCFFSFI